MTSDDNRAELSNSLQRLYQFVDDGGNQYDITVRCAELVNQCTHWQHKQDVIRTIYWRKPYCMDVDLFCELTGIDESLFWLLLPANDWFEPECSICGETMHNFEAICWEHYLERDFGFRCNNCRSYDPANRLLKYPDYLKSNHWNNMRIDALEYAGHKCQLCSSTKRLQVHHRTYKNLGRERPSDLIVLCSKCHSTFHSQLKVQS